METALKKDRKTILSGLTIADGLLALIILAGGIMRLFDLGNLPLSPAEAAEAIASWQFWQPGGVSSVGSPAYFSLTSLLMPLSGDSDAVMRLIPALVGVGMVLLPWLLRHRLGTIGTLTASLLLTISPIQAIISRTVGGDALALFAILFMLVAAIRYSESNASQWLRALFAGAAVGLTSAPLFYGGLVTLLFMGRGSWRKHLPDGDQAMWRRTAAAPLTLFLALSTLFLLHLPGLGAAAMLPAQWITQFGYAPAMVLEPLLAFIRYEPFLTVVGVTAVFWAIRSNNTLAKRLAAWSGLVFILILLQPGQMNNAALLTLPMALLVGLLAQDIMQTGPSRLGWAWAGGAVLLGSLIFVNLARYSRIISASPQDFGSAWVILMAVITGLVTIYFLSTWEGTAVIQGTFIALLILSIFYQWGTGWWLSHEAANDPRERWVTLAADDDVRLLVTTLQDISRQVTNADHELDIFSSVDSPVLRWYLRDFHQVKFGNSPPVDGQYEAVISLDNAELTLGSKYAGADFGILRNGLMLPELPSPTPGLDLLRWWLFHDSSLAAHEERVILWWRTDLSNKQ